MAITRNCAKFLFYAKEIGVSYTHTLTLGRLNLYAEKEDIQNQIEQFKNNELKLSDVKFADGYSEPLFKILGAKEIDSLDYSDYEKATIVHDLNTPIPESLKNKFDAIVDGGTIEHVFNFPVAIKNCMEALKVGGHFIGITPANNQMGHGFYQFSPDLLYRVFSRENGFLVEKMILSPLVDENNSKWYEVADPKIVNSRVMLVNSVPVSILFVAKKIKEAEIFKNVPQQTDYAITWAANHSLKTGMKPSDVSTLKHFYRLIIPKPLKNFLRNIHSLFTREKMHTADLGEIDALHYKKIEI